MYHSKKSMVADVIHKQKQDVMYTLVIGVVLFAVCIWLIFIVSSWWTTVLGVVIVVFTCMIIIGTLVGKQHVRKFKEYVPFYDRGDVFLDHIVAQTNSATVTIVKEDLKTLVEGKMLKSMAIYEETGQVIIASLGSKTPAEIFLKYIPFYNKEVVLLSDIELQTNTSSNALHIELHELVSFGAIKTPIVDEANSTIIIKTPSPLVLPMHTGDEAVDALLQKGVAAIAEFGSLQKSIPDAHVQKKIDKIISATVGIFQILASEPAFYDQVKHFVNYYLPKTLKLLTSYKKFRSSNMQSENVSNMLETINIALDTLVAKFKETYDSLYKRTALDIEKDIEVLDMMLKLDSIHD